MKRVLVIAVLLLSGSLASAQPVPPSWRPPTGCSTGQTITWSGTAWQCGTAGITNSAGANVITKSNGTNLVASSWTDDGTTSTTTGALAVNGNATLGSLQVSRTDAAASGRVVFQRFHGANNNAAGDGGLVRFNMGNTMDAYNVEIGAINTLGSPSFLNPKFAVRVQNIDTTGTANVTERFSVTNTGAIVNAGLTPTAVAASAGTTLELSQVDGTSNYLSIRGAGTKGILFANGNAADDGKIVYDQLARGMTFGTSGVYRMSLDSAGSLVIGDSANTAGTGNLTATGNVAFGGANTNTITVTSGISGRLRTVSAPPTLSTCGTSTAVGSNLAGRITSVGSPTACTLTFAAAFAVTPACVLTPAGGVSLYISAQSTTAITVTTVSGVALPNFNYSCFETP